jgi:hypothetical protein
MLFNANGLGPEKYIWKISGNISLYGGMGVDLSNGNAKRGDIKVKTERK